MTELSVLARGECWSDHNWQLASVKIEMVFAVACTKLDYEMHSWLFKVVHI